MSDQDREIGCMAAMVGPLYSLQWPERLRVMTWLCDRFNSDFAAFVSEWEDAIAENRKRSKAARKVGP